MLITSVILNLFSYPVWVQCVCFHRRIDIVSVRIIIILTCIFNNYAAGDGGRGTALLPLTLSLLLFVNAVAEAVVPSFVCASLSASTATLFARAAAVSLKILYACSLWPRISLGESGRGGGMKVCEAGWDITLKKIIRSTVWAWPQFVYITKIITFHI